MFVAKLKCKNCGYCSEEFCFGYNIHDRTYTGVYRNRKTKFVEIRGFSLKEQERAGVVDSDPEEMLEFSREKAESDEEVLSISINKEEKENIGRCPRCEEISLRIELDGIV